MIFTFSLVSSNPEQIELWLSKLEGLYSLQLTVNESRCVVGFYQKLDYQPTTTLKSVTNRLRLSDSDFHFVSHNTSVKQAISHQPNDFESILSNCEGPFILFQWNRTNETLNAACDPLGQYSLYYAQTKSGFVCCSEASFISSLIGPNILKEEGVSCWLAGQPNPSTQIFDTLYPLPFAHYLQLDHKALSISQYWSVTHPPENTVCDEVAIDQFENLLRQSVAQNIGTDQHNVMSQMSGGMDSSSVTALATEHQHSNGNKLISLSHFYSKSPESDESDLIKLLSNSLNCDDHILMPADNDQYSDFLSLYPTDFDSPGTVLSPRYHHELQHCQQHNVSLLLTGNGGDEMCWGHATAYTERFLKGDLSVVREVFIGCKQTGIPFRAVAKKLFIKPLIPSYIMSILGKTHLSDTDALPNWLTPKARDMACTSLTLKSPFCRVNDPVHYARHHTLKTTATFNSLRSYQKVGAQYGIKVAHPFFDKHIAQHSFDVSPKQLIRGAYPKWLLRSAMDKYLPKEVCWNTHKTTFDQHFTNLVRANAVQLRKVLSHPKLADLGLLEPTPLLAQFDKVIESKTGYVTVNLLYAILTQIWITQHHDN